MKKDGEMLALLEQPVMCPIGMKSPVSLITYQVPPTERPNVLWLSNCGLYKNRL